MLFSAFIEFRRLDRALSRWPTEQIVPLWWMDPVRVPAGSEIWRVTADGQQTFIASYMHVGIGWVTPHASPGPRAGWIAPSETLGVCAVWRGHRVVADVLSDGSVIVCSPAARDGMQQSQRGFWWQQVSASEVSGLSGLRDIAQWKGLPVQVVRQFTDEGRRLAEVAYVGRNADVAEAAALMKTDAGVYEATVDWQELTDLQGLELTPVAR